MTKEKAAHVWSKDPFHWYVEGQECTRALARVERFSGPIYDPSCGQGNIIRALGSVGYDCFGTDIRNRVGDAEWFRGERDYMDSLDGMEFDFASIVMNPPFYGAKGTEAFIRRALDEAEHKVACFAEVRFLCGGKRAAGLFSDCPPTRIWHLSPRPSCPPGEYLLAGNKAGGGSLDYCWLVWDRTAPHAGTQTGWLRILPEDRSAA
jgi:hypothetical protein